MDGRILLPTSVLRCSWIYPVIHFIMISCTLRHMQTYISSVWGADLGQMNECKVDLPSIQLWAQHELPILAFSGFSSHIDRQVVSRVQNNNIKRLPYFSLRNFHVFFFHPVAQQQIFLYVRYNNFIILESLSKFLHSMI